MRFLYNLGILSYVLLIKIVSPFNTKAKQWLDGRKNIFTTIKNSLNLNDKKVWFHVSSLGEFEQGRPAIEAFKKEYPKYKIVLTFFSPSGFEVRKNYEGADYVFYLPYDSKSNAKKFIQLINPEIAFFVKYEFWFHYLNELNKQNIPVYIFSAIFRPNQLFFKWYGKWYLDLLRKFTFLYVQNNESLKLLQSKGINNIEIGGDTRFDRVFSIAKNAKNLPLIAKFAEHNTVIIGGSTWEKDEELLFSFIKQAAKPFKMIIAPHEVHDKNINRIINYKPNAVLKFSEANEQNILEAQILLIDSIGILSSVYQYGNIAYIGNGFGSGIHNTLEAATFGLPVIFGPNYKRFQEASDLLALKAGFTIKDSESLNNVFNMLLQDVDMRKSAGKSASDYVKSMCGGTQKLLTKIALN